MPTFWDEPGSGKRIPWKKAPKKDRVAVAKRKPQKRATAKRTGKPKANTRQGGQNY